MRGHVVKRFKGSYSIVISLGRDPATGKYRQHFESVKGTKKDAEKRLSELLTQLDRGIYVKPGKSTLADYLASWLKDYCWPNLAPRSAEGYEYIVHTHLIPSLGKIPLTELKPQHLQHLYAEKLLNGRADCKGGLSNRSVQYMHVTLHKALSNAVRMGMIARNVADAVERPKVPRREMQTMSESDIHIFLEYAKSTLYYALFYTALFTGMRRSELLGLRWQDTDLLLCQISVNRTLHQLSNGEIVIRPCKTEKSREVLSIGV